MTNILLVDNHDSFTYNIAHIIRNIEGVKLDIISSEEIDPENCRSYNGIIFSPGPDLPAKGDSMELILNKLSDNIPVLGICLGLQAIAIWGGASLTRLPVVAHGKSIRVIPTGEPSSIIPGEGDLFDAGLYHSWAVNKDSLPSELKITALSQDGVVMGLRHLTRKVEGIQFHPESIMTPDGGSMLKRWVESL